MSIVLHLERRYTVYFYYLKLKELESKKKTLIQSYFKMRREKKWRRLSSFIGVCGRMGGSCLKLQIYFFSFRSSSS